MENTDKYGHSIYFDSEKCVGDMACLKVCPAEAIRIRTKVRNKVAVMLEDKCIDCGECVKVCKSEAIVPLTNTFKDFSKFKYTVAIPSIALYTQFEKNIKPPQILSLLRKIGFDEVFDISQASITVYRGIERHIQSSKIKPLISPFCPTVVKLIQTKYPELLSHLLPIISPLELVAGTVKEQISKRTGLKNEEIGIIYITPCPSKTILILQKLAYTNQGKSCIDGAIPISEIYPLLMRLVNQPVTHTAQCEHYEINGFGLKYGSLGGLTSMLENDNCIAVSGVNNIIYILEGIERGKLRNVDLVDMHACMEGCLGGIMVVENAYIARSRLNSLIRYYGDKKPPIGKKDNYENRNIYDENIYKPQPIKPIDINIRNAIAKVAKQKEIYQQLPQINCGACGCPSCLIFAEEVVQGILKLENCVALEFSLDSSPQPKEQPPKKRKQKKQTIREIPR
ncbi:MAG: 4Fe-4S dicluster domain-containing protein [Ignavibacteria bacterium]|nr:4Fe-4S dicluster domain-containing protein [Ignavibacteria bacterium]